MHSRSKSCMIIPVQMRPAPKTKLFQLKRKFLFSFVSITLIFFHIFPFLKAPQVCTCGVFMPRRISLQFRHKFSMNYLNSLSNFVTIPDAGSCMIVSDKRMKHFHKRSAARPEFLFKSGRLPISLFWTKTSKKIPIYFFFFFLLSEKIAAAWRRGFFHAEVSDFQSFPQQFRNNFYRISSKTVLHMVTQSRIFCGILIPELRKTKKHAT